MSSAALLLVALCAVGICAQIASAQGYYPYGYYPAVAGVEFGGPGYYYGYYTPPMARRSLVEGGYYGYYYDTPPARRMTMEASSSAAAISSAVEKGNCFCHYDYEWNSWAVGEATCQKALLERCDKDARLPCYMVEEYSNPSSNRGFSKVYEKEIFNYLFETCPPAEPCTCALKYDGSDDAADVARCCTDLEAYCQVPGAGLSCASVEKFCGAATVKADTTTAIIKSWTAGKLANAQCPALSASEHVYSHTAKPVEAVNKRNLLTVEFKPVVAAKFHSLIAVFGAVAGVACLAGLVVLRRISSRREIPL